jgi:micrococcal nuclease
MLHKLTFVVIGAFLLGAGIASVFWMELPPRHNLSGQYVFAAPLEKCIVLKVYDGDTLACDINNNGHIDDSTEHIRLLGIDATEMHWSPKNHTGKDEPYAKEAMDYVVENTMYKPIYLEYDNQIYDKYNRRLAYIYLDPDGNTMLNKQLLEKGLARVLIIGVNRRYSQEFYALQDQAKSQHLNLWTQS